MYALLALLLGVYLGQEYPNLPNIKTLVINTTTFMCELKDIEHVKNNKYDVPDEQNDGSVSYWQWKWW